MTRTEQRELKLLRATVRSLASRLAAVERELGLGRGARRVSAARAAELIGCDPRTVRRMIQDGELEGAVIELPGRSRRRWVVLLSAVEALLGERSDSCPAAAPAAPEPPESSRRAAGCGKRSA